MMVFLLPVYEILLLVGLVVNLFPYIYKKKIDWEGLLEKFTFYSSQIRNLFAQSSASIWIQAVSVGEVLLVRRLIKELELKNHTILITTTTLTGKRVAKKFYPHIPIVYFPFDFTFLLLRALNLFKPKIFIAVETEIWPNLYCRLKRRGTKILIINGRISEKAFFYYRKVKFFMKKIFSLIDYVGVKDNISRERFSSLGMEEEKISVVGNLKLASLYAEKKDLDDFYLKYGKLKKKGEILLVAGSTHPGEEEMIIEIYQQLLEKFPNLKLIVGPRHLQRISLLEKMIEQKGFLPQRISRKGWENPQPPSIYILDTIGELFYFYSLADVCLVGGSWVKFGGHNILEPLYFLKPTLFGPYMENFKEIEEVVLEKKAGIKVKDKKELKEILEKLIGDSEAREKLSLRISRVFEEGEVILKRNIDIISKYL
ncbi:MAG: hypothetical protein DRP68_03965 [Candidatus Omnitrophota bacterium]|nr:MAG: hypothetical protein DRP68_03965 [Candidatus Omnitrophota bacterium]HDN86022.1 hypothetical protein [Candidatus Omnitrophota bacterium]